MLSPQEFSLEDLQKQWRFRESFEAVCEESRWQQKLIINLSWHVKGQTVKIAISALRERRKRLQGKYGVHTDML